MFNKLFGKKEKVETEHLVAPFTGEAVGIEKVPDPTFSEKMMGDGLAVVPSDGKCVSPIDGEVIQVFPTLHAIGIRGRSGIELLLHIGLETVSLNGEGFESHVKAGDKVKAGQLLMNVDLSVIEEKASSTITPLVITNMDLVETTDKRTGAVVAGETEWMTVHLKK